MKKLCIEKTEFVTSAPNEKSYPTLKDASDRTIPEIAFVGRSNVGKSSLINHLVRRKNLARTSSTPGKTQLINFFLVDQCLALVDLPGYGYAKVSQKLRKEWAVTIQNYLERREPLNLIVFLFDIRRKPNDDDFALIDWLIHYQMPFVLVLTKADKFTKTQRQVHKKRILESFNVEGLQAIMYSTTKNIGRQELLNILTEVIDT